MTWRGWFTALARLPLGYSQSAFERSGMAGVAHGQASDAEMRSTLASLYTPDMNTWNSREVLLWFIDQNWLNLLDDFKDVNGALLLDL